MTHYTGRHVLDAATAARFVPRPFTSTERAVRAVIAKWYVTHEHDRPRPTLAKQPAPALACRAVRVACYAQFLRVVEA